MRFIPRLLLGFGVVAAPPAAPSAHAQAVAPAVPQDSAAAAIHAIVTSARHPWSRYPEFPRFIDDLLRLYAARTDAPLWLDGGRLTAPGRAALAELRAATTHGLDPVDYDAPALDTLARRLESGSAAPTAPLAPLGLADRGRFDALLSVALVRYLGHLHGGRRPPATPLGGPELQAPRFDFAAAVSRAVAGDSVGRLVAAMAPQLAQYRNLRAVLARYRALATDSALPAIPALARGASVQPGEPYPGMVALRRRLVALGDLGADDRPLAPTYDDSAVAAVRRFQRRHGLEADGMLRAGTVAALNEPLAKRVRQIELALERLRWLPPIGRQRFLVVNIPAFELFAFDSVGGTGAPALHMPVIVGRALNTRTPVLLQALRYMDFRPYWNVPRSILVNEVLPAMRRHPNYLRDNDMEVVGARDAVLGDGVTLGVLQGLQRGELRVRQRPGSANALGAVKFVFPNAENVYLHGTPNPGLFARTRRDFSHGCIRLSDPAGLAEWVLRGQAGWDRPRIDAAMAPEARTTRVLLPKPMPVVVFYTTAVVWPDGAVWFYPDIYGHDAALDAALRAGPTVP